MDERTYAEDRDRLRSALSRLADVAGRRGSSEVAADARALDAKLVENRFDVVVLGEFKRGKTTLVNALLGAPLLPVGVTPLTSIVTVVRWGADLRAVVRFLDGREEEVPVAELSRYVTESENPANLLGVDRAVLSCPADVLRDGVVLVDMPGVGSVFHHNTQTARKYLPHVDAAIFLTSVDPPISDTERRFLGEVQEHARKIFFVLNKVDHLPAGEREEALAFTARVIRDALGRDVRVYPLSARGAVEAKAARDLPALEASGFATFERDLRAFLLAEKGDALHLSVAARARRLLEDERNSLAVEERGLMLSLEEIERTIGRMEEVFARAERSRLDLRVLVAAEVRELIAGVDRDLELLRRTEEERLRRAAASFLEACVDPRGAADELEELLRATLARDIDGWRADEERRIAAALASATDRLVRQADDLATETVRLCGEILGVDLRASSIPPGLAGGCRFTFSFLDPPTILESILPNVRRLLPKRTARRLLERDLRRRIPELVDRHGGRLRWDLLQRIERTRRELEAALEGRAVRTISSLRSGIDRAERARSEGREATVRRVGEIRSVRADLEVIGWVLTQVVQAHAQEVSV